MIALIEAMIFSGMNAFNTGINDAARRGRRGPVRQVRVVRASEAHRLSQLLRMEMEKTARLTRRNRELEQMATSLQNEVDAAHRVFARRQAS